MDKSTLIKMFPAFCEIQDKDLQERSLEAMEVAMKKGGWDETNIDLCPVSLGWKDCDVSWQEHVSAVVDLCRSAYDLLGKHYEQHGVAFSRDILIAGALLHDIGKLTEFVCRDGKAVHGENFRLIRHPLSGAVIAAEAGLPDSIVHLIAVHSFEGDKSYQTPESTFVRTIDVFVFNCSVKGLEKL